MRYTIGWPLEALLSLCLNRLSRNIRHCRKYLNRSRQVLQQNKYILDFMDVVEREDRFYFAYFSDFRGRIYSTSQVHPIQNKLSRVFMMPCKGGEGPRLLSIQDLDISSRYTQTLLSYSELVYHLYPEGCRGVKTQLDDLDLFMLITIGLEAGKLLKSDLVSEQFRLSAREFIELGFRGLADGGEPKPLSLDEKLQMLKLRHELEFFLVNGVWRDFPITRDSTASALQH